MSPRSLAAVLLVLACARAGAEPVLSCEDVDTLGEALTGLGVALDDEDMPIGEGSPEDAALRDIVDDLGEISVAEQDMDLAAAADGMDEAWHAMDRDAFTDALADAVAKLAVISATECD